MFSLASAPLAQDADPAIVHYQLDNGLEVILAPDSRAPKVVLNVAFKVGSMNEPPGRSGFAHLFEHLMFSGTPAYPNIDAAYGALGVSLNAWTYEDETVYYEEGLSSSLPYILALEADRMANQGQAITQEDLDIQRAVVLNEMRENVLDTPSGAGWEGFRSALFPPGHPYHRPVLGSIADI
ncbi:MAG: M16 family metallopeptidase, partial [Devosia sp.]